MRRYGQLAARRLVLEVVGWGLVVLGLVMLVMPGPGLLTVFAGLVVLSRQYDWARRRIAPLRRAALQGASESVQSGLRILLTLGGIATIAAVGVFWGVQPPAPSWWPVNPDWWLIGGWATGGTLLASAAFALGLLVYSYRRFRGDPYDHGADEPGHAAD